jgi:hypothetical protein
LHTAIARICEFQDRSVWKHGKACGHMYTEPTNRAVWILGGSENTFRIGRGLHSTRGWGFTRYDLVRKGQGSNGVWTKIVIDHRI